MDVPTHVSVPICNRKLPTLWLALGLLLAIKQYSILLIPLSPLLLPRGDGWRDSIKAKTPVVMLLVLLK